MPPHRLAALAALTLLSCVGARAQERVPYTEAQFHVPADPTRAVLHVTTSAMDMTVRSLTLYGDGRLLLSDNRSGEYVRQLEFTEVERVVSDAVAHGLAEWDALAIHAQQLTKTQGKPFPPRADATRVLILLGVDDYHRGDYEVEHVERKITMSDPYYLAEHFPEIPQFQGIRNVFLWMVDQLETAKTEGRE